MPHKNLRPKWPQHLISAIAKHLPLKDTFRLHLLSKHFAAAIAQHLSSAPELHFAYASADFSLLSSKVAESCHTVRHFDFSCGFWGLAPDRSAASSAMLLTRFARTLRSAEGLPSGVLALLSDPESVLQRLNGLSCCARAADVDVLAHGRTSLPAMRRLVLTILNEDVSLAAAEAKYPNLVEKVVERCPNLEKLVIATYREIGLESSVRVLSRLKGLKMMGLIGFDLSDEDLLLVGRCEGLKVLSLGLTRRITVEGVRALGEIAESLETIAFFSNGFGPKVVTAFVDRKRFPVLKKIVASEIWGFLFAKDMARLRPDVCVVVI